MALSDSVFLFEIMIEELKSYVNCCDFIIKSEFANIFNFQLKNPARKEIAGAKKLKRVVSRSKMKMKKAFEPKLIGPNEQSLFFMCSVNKLKTLMTKYPMELTLWSKLSPDFRIGSTLIPWNKVFIEYLDKLNEQHSPQSAIVNDHYNVFDEYSSKRMATLNLNIKLTYLRDSNFSRLLMMPDGNSKTLIGTCFNSKAINPLSTIAESCGITQENTGIIKTIYSGGKQKKKSSNNKIKRSKNYCSASREQIIDSATKSSETSAPEVTNISNADIIGRNIVSLVKSDMDIRKTKQISLFQSKSCSSIRRNLNTLNYIFGGQGGPFGNQVYCVGYFTVGSEPSNLALKSSDKESEQSSKKYKFRLCNMDCPSRQDLDGHADSLCTLDLPEEATQYISVKKCDDVRCDNREHRPPIYRPDDRILLKLNNLQDPCCHATEKVSEVEGEGKATLKVGEGPCFCQCECTFGFKARTTFCQICGGYEKIGEELAGKPAFTMPTPCPVYHKLVDKIKLKTASTSGSESKQKDTSQRSFKKPSGRTGMEAVADSEKDLKQGKKKKKDERFKFNYGYKGIPPQIGHSNCGMPCTGTLNNVPKNMGWLWTAEDIPGMKVAQGWKPGAVSKHLLKKLKKAKRTTLKIQTSLPIKKFKKKSEDKPLLIISKKEGVYRVEMQTTSEKADGGNDPLIYSIASAGNEAKVMRKQKLQKRLTKKAVEKVWSDPFHPEACQLSCQKVYERAFGLMPYDTLKTEYLCTGDNYSMESCDDETLSDSSLDVDWEIQFTPPGVR